MNDKERIEKVDKVHLYIAVRRKKENRDLQEICFRQVIRDEEIDLEVIRTRIKHFPGVWRIYHTCNARNINEAKKILMKKLIDEPEAFNHKIDTLWKTALVNKECKAERNFLIDIDTKDIFIYNDIHIILEKQDVNILQSIESPNGYHIVTNCFDTRKLLEYIEEHKDVEFHRDAQYFVDKIIVDEDN